MEYNSQKEILIMPEYGRNVQNMINFARTVEDDEKRFAYVQSIVQLMHNMNPQSRNIEESKVKLWKHVFRIAKYDLDVQPPNMEKPTSESDQKKPDRVPYPSSEARFRHYGNHVQRLIQKALSMEEGPVRQGFAVTIASYMKLAYKTWNREHFVNDDVIIDDLATISDGKLDLHEGADISSLAQNAMNKRGIENVNKGGGGGKNKNRKKSKRRRRRNN